MWTHRNYIFYIQVVFLGNLVNSIFLENDLIVNLPDGKIKGHRVVTSEFISYKAWQGIPFATPPIGKLRFQAPVPPKPWSGILNTTKDGNCCISFTVPQQFQLALNQSGDLNENQSEDCLYLNVYVPIIKTSFKPLPVMLWIYGGGFYFGCASQFGPEYLVNKQVIVVTFNYRIGSFGFFSTGDQVVLGNAGLKDQLLAMKWTKKNIHLFGGDPNKITLFGESAGGFSTGIHIWNKKSAGLFRAAICQSGCSFTLEENGDPKATAYAFAKAANPNVTENITSVQIADLLQSLSAADLNKINTILLGVVVEASSKDAFVTTNKTFDLIKSGDFNRVPLITGTTSEEFIGLFGSLGVTQALANLPGLDELILFLSNINPKPSANRSEIIRLIKDKYAGKNMNFSQNLAGFLEFTADAFFVIPAIKQAELQSKYVPVYLYEFSYYGEPSKARNYPDIQGAEKVGHSDELPYLFKFENRSIAIEDRLTRQRLLTLWTNFAKTLDPTPNLFDPLLNVKWPKVQPDNIRYLNINNTLKVQPLSPDEKDRFSFWNNLFDKYATRPFVRF